MANRHGGDTAATIFYYPLLPNLSCLVVPKTYNLQSKQIPNELVELNGFVALHSNHFIVDDSDNTIQLAAERQRAPNQSVRVILDVLPKMKPSGKHHHQTMNIKPTDIEIPQHDPFEHDLLDRARTIKILTNLLRMSIEPGATWHLVNQGFPVVSFNVGDRLYRKSLCRPLVRITRRSPKPRKHQQFCQLLRILVTKGVPWAISLAGLAVAHPTK